MQVGMHPGTSPPLYWLTYFYNYTVYETSTPQLLTSPLNLKAKPNRHLGYCSVVCIKLPWASKLEDYILIACVLATPIL